MHSLSFSEDAIELRSTGAALRISYASISGAVPALSSPAFIRALDLRFISRARAPVCVSLRSSDGHHLDFVCVTASYKRSFVRGLCDALGRVDASRAVVESIEAVLLQPLEVESSLAAASAVQVQAQGDDADADGGEAQENAVALRVMNPAP